MGTLTGFLDSVANGVLGPKGTLGDWQHAKKLYITDNQKFAPKYKFLYHVTFYITSGGQSVVPIVSNFTNEIGMLVKSCDLPKFTATVETKNKYNRKKHIQTQIQYDPINITFHDDNYGVTTALLEAYYKYYYADGYHGISNGAYGNRSTGDTTYDGEGTNSFKFGLDNGIPSMPFFDRIEISQMARRAYTKYTLINPLLSNWSHDTVDNADGSSTMTNTITVTYDAVSYDRGTVQGGANGNPAGFGREDHYDVTPSPLSPLGGGSRSIDDMIGTGLDLYEYITQGKNFDNPFEAAIAAANLIGNVRDLDSNDLRQGGLSIVRDTIGSVAGIDVSGVPLTVFPKNNGTGGAGDLALATVAVAGLSAIAGSTSGVNTTTGDTNPQTVSDSQFQNFLKSYQSSGRGGNINDIRAEFNALSTSEKSQYS